MNVRPEAPKRQKNQRILSDLTRSDHERLAYRFRLAGVT